MSNTIGAEIEADRAKLLLGGEVFRSHVNQLIFNEVRTQGDYYNSLIENIVNKEIGDDPELSKRWKNIGRELITMVLATDRLSITKLISAYRESITVSPFHIPEIRQSVFSMIADAIYICNDTTHMLKSIVKAIRHKLETTSPEKSTLAYKPEPLKELKGMGDPYPPYPPYSTKNVRKLGAETIYLKEAVARKFFDYVVEAQFNAERPAYQIALEEISEIRKQALAAKNGSKIGSKKVSTFVQKWQAFKAVLETNRQKHKNFVVQNNMPEIPPTKKLNRRWNIV